MLLLDTLNEAMSIDDCTVSTVIESSDLTKDFSLSPIDKLDVFLDESKILVCVNANTKSENNDVDVFAVSPTNTYPYSFVNENEKRELFERMVSYA